MFSPTQSQISSRPLVFEITGQSSVFKSSQISALSPVVSREQTYRSKQAKIHRRSTRNLENGVSKKILNQTCCACPHLKQTKTNTGTAQQHRKTQKADNCGRSRGNPENVNNLRPTGCKSALRTKKNLLVDQKLSDNRPLRIFLMTPPENIRSPQYNPARQKCRQIKNIGWGDTPWSSPH